MNEVYLKLGIVVASAVIFVYIMNKVQNRRIQEAQDRFESMMKARGLSLTVLDKKEVDKPTKLL